MVEKPRAGMRAVNGLTELARILESIETFSGRFKSAYYKALGAMVREPWLAKLDGPSPLTKKLGVAGTEYVLVSSCKNTDCGDNNTVLLYSAVQGVVYGKIYERGKTTLIGAPPSAVVRELERLWRQTR